MFQLNTYLLHKMGWIKYSGSRGIGMGPQIFDEDPLVKFFFDDKSRKNCFLIKELDTDEKQKSKNLYKFVLLDYSNMVDKSKFKPKFETVEFNSNIELMKLVIDFEAANDTYQRHFKLNKILK
jgi:hypothetical protein